MKLWNGPLTSLLVDGRVKAMGGDGLENWQLERLIDDAHEAPMFNALALTPQRGRFVPLGVLYYHFHRAFRHFAIHA